MTIMWSSPFTRRLAVGLVAGLLTSCGGKTEVEKQADTVPAQSPKPPFGVIDVPRNGSTMTGKVLHVGGWALSEVGIKEISLYVDGSPVMSGQIDGDRPDVAKAFPNIPNGQHSGWNIMLDTSTIAPGQHQLVARAVDTRGSASDIGSVSVTIKR